jgi:hypothetical protein
MIPHENEPDPVAPPADDVAQHGSDPDRRDDAQIEILVSLFEEAYYYGGPDADPLLVDWRQRVWQQLGYPCHLCGHMCICPDQEKAR